MLRGLRCSLGREDSSVPLSVHHVIARRDAEILRLARVSDLRLPPLPHVLLLLSLCDVLWQDSVWGHLTVMNLSLGKIC